MNEITVFENDNFGKLRTFLESGEPWFVASDVCKALDIDRTAVRRLDKDEKGVRSIHTPGGDQEMTTVSESGLYSLILGSRKPEAHRFKRWVTHEVLPTIRKTGAYVSPSLSQQIINDPDVLFLVLEQLRQERASRIAAEQAAADTRLRLADVTRKYENMRPVTAFVFDGDPDAEYCVSVAQLAALLSCHGRTFSRNAMFSWLREHGYVRKDSPLPTHKAIESGRMIIVEKHSARSRYYTSAVTLAGQLYFSSLLI